MASEQVNGQSYYEMVDSYYRSAMYDEGITIMDNLFDETTSTFNPVPKVVNIAVDLSVGGELKYINDSNGFIEEFLDFNDFDNLKSVLAKVLIEGKKVLVELIEDSSEQGDTNYKMVVHNADDYEIITDGKKIYQAEINTLAYVYNSEEEAYEEVQITKRYVKTDSGVKLIVEGIEGQDTGDDDTLDPEQDIQGEVIPVVEITTGYDLKQLMYSTDRYNEIDSFIRNIFYLAGEPILAGFGVKKLREADTDEMATDRYKKQKMLFAPSPDKADLRLLEIQGTSATTMIEKQRQIVETIVNDYPEFAMSEVISGSNVSSDTTRIRLSEILSRVNELRTSIQKGLDEMIRITSTIQGATVEGRVELGEVIGKDLNSMMELLEKAMGLKLISRESAMSQLVELYINEDVADELNKIKTEATDPDLNFTDVSEDTGTATGGDQGSGVDFQETNNNADDSGTTEAI